MSLNVTDTKKDIYVIRTPASISEATATRLKEFWEANFAEYGKVLVLSDGLSLEVIRSA
jgi:hypothetical protein